MDEKAFFEKLGSTLDSAVAKIANFSRIKDQTLKDKDGNEFKLEKESGAPTVGDKAAPDGTFVMGDGKIITITGGVVTEVKEPTADKSELDLANEKIAELEAKITDAEKAKSEAETAKTVAETEKAEAEKVKVAAQGIVTELTNLKNSWVPSSRQKNFGNMEKVGDVDLTKVKEIGEKIKSKKE